MKKNAKICFTIFQDHRDLLAQMEDREGMVPLVLWDHLDHQEQKAKEEALDRRDLKVKHLVNLSLQNV